MWLLNTSTYRLEEFHGENIPKYAILSHTWAKEEVSFIDVQEGTQGALQGWLKVQSCCQQALADDYAYVWADTCCIDKRNIVDLSEALNSMFRWYKEAAVCYTYLSDVNLAESYLISTDSASMQTIGRRSNTVSHSHDQQPSSRGSDHDDYEDSRERQLIGSMIIGSRWFTRGWTLQELVAPKSLVFYDDSWTCLGTKNDYVSQIESRTNIPREALQDLKPEDYCIAQKMAWAAGRRTTRPEDRAYSLLGLLGISLNLIYGEGAEEAFFRLQRKLIKRLDDTSILIWNRISGQKYSHWLLAPSPDAFEGCHIYQEYKSCATGLDLSKTALTGSFYTRIDCFSIACACLGHFRECSKDKLPLDFRDRRDVTHVNTIGMLLLELPGDVYQPVTLDRKRHLLSSYHFGQHGQNSSYRRKMNIASVQPEFNHYSSTEAISIQYPKRHEEFGYALICPGVFWLGGDRENRLSRPISDIDRLKETRAQALISQNRNGPLLVTRGIGTQHCFVISKPGSNAMGKVVHFGYDLTDRPTVSEGEIRDMLTSTVLTIGAYQDIDTTKGLVEVASRQISTYQHELDLSITTAKQWADGPEFDQLVEGENKNGTLLPDGTRIIKLGDNIKVIFLPQDSGAYPRHRVLLAFRGNFHAVSSFPRAWLWPVQDDEVPSEKLEENKKWDGSFTTRLKGLFTRN